jgi:hypothetical protein
MQGDIEEVLQRNLLRRNAGLPALSFPQELAKPESAMRQAAFEREFEASCHLLEQSLDQRQFGWLSRVGRWSEARSRLRDEMFRR